MTTMINPPKAKLFDGLSSAEPVLFQQTVPRQLVHRAAVSEVFVTDVCVTGETTFQVGAQWPRSHGFFGPKALFHDPMLLAETIRQATLAIAHQVFAVPQNANFILQEVVYLITRDGLRLDGRPANIVLSAGAHDIRQRGGELSGMRVEYSVYRDMKRVGSGDIGWRCVTPASYARLRGDRYGRQWSPARLPAPVDPRLVGRDKEADVVLAVTEQDDRWLLRVDQGHPVMFDHPVDHVPGMVAMEAARQAALLWLGRPDAVPVLGSFAFTRYIELDLPCTVLARPWTPKVAGSVGVEVVLEQSGRVGATAKLELLSR
jgi:hypothetical protein